MKSSSRYCSLAHAKTACLNSVSLHRGSHTGAAANAACRKSSPLSCSSPSAPAHTVELHACQQLHGIPLRYSCGD
jgi:hypothetical protein